MKIILLAILEPWVEYCSHNFLEIFAQGVFAENEVGFTANCIRCSSIRLGRMCGYSNSLMPRLPFSLSGHEKCGHGWCMGIITSLKPRLFVPDLVSQLWRKIQNGKPGFEATKSHNFLTTHLQK